jgi:hypothetical protein
MRAAAGDRIVLESERVTRPSRTGVIEAVLSADRSRYQVHWDDGHTSIITPASGAAWLLEPPDERFAGQNIFRSINDRILELDGAWADEHQFVCECADLSCSRVMRLQTWEYETVRADPAQFAVLPGHEQPWSNQVVIRSEGYVVVKKRPDRWA